MRKASDAAKWPKEMTTVPVPFLHQKASVAAWDALGGTIWQAYGCLVL